MNEDALFKLLQSNDEINVRIAAEIVAHQPNPEELWDRLIRRFPVADFGDLEDQFHEVYMMTWYSRDLYHIDEYIFNKHEL